MGLLRVTSTPAGLSFLGGDENNAYDSDCRFHFDNWTITLVPVYILLTSVLGMVFNVFVLMIFCFNKKPWTVPEIYLGNLAAADLALMCSLPLWAVYVFKRFSWTFGLFMCKVFNESLMMNSNCSIYFLAMVSIDRYLALVHPLSLRRMREPLFAKLGCLLVWTLGFILSIPTFIYWDTKSDNSIKNVTVCFVNYPSSTLNLTFNSIIFVFSLIIPISIISFCTVNIIKTLRSRVMNSLNAERTNHKATIMVLAVLLAYLICWVPYHLLRIPYVLLEVGILTECKVRYIIHICLQIFSYLAVFNSVLNPILYVMVGKKFKQKVQRHFKLIKEETTL